MEATAALPQPRETPRTEPRVDRDSEFAEFFTGAWPRLYRTALGITGDAGAAEDALQSAFAKAYAAWSRVRRADQPEAYVRRMVVNEIIGSHRYGWRRRERPHERIEPPGAVPSPERGIVERDAVWAAVQALPVRQRAVIVLRYYEDLSEEQIAEVLRCSRGTVKSQASAALTNLRRLTGADPDGDRA
jgi:RNA polymerase sigma-70 factor (sigma-E family)